MGCSHSSHVHHQHQQHHHHHHQRPRCQLKLEISTNGDHEKCRSRPRVLRNILKGLATKNHRLLVPTSSTSTNTNDVSSTCTSRLWLNRAVLYHENRTAFIEGMQQHGWLNVTELYLCRCGLNHVNLESVMAALNEVHVRLEVLQLQMRYEGATPTLELILEFLHRQQHLRVLDLSGSYIHTFDLPSFVYCAVFGHANLQKLVLSNTNVGDHTATLLFRALAGDPSSVPQAIRDQLQNTTTNNNIPLVPHLKHLELSSQRYMQGTLGSMGVSSTVELLECLPFMQSLDTLVLQHCTFRRRPKSTPPPSATYMVHIIFFLDAVYQRFHLLQDRLPSALWPILGYVEEESTNGVAAAPYFSKRASAWNQLLLAGFPMTVSDHNSSSSNQNDEHSRVLVSQLLPDWKECWLPQTKTPESTLAFDDRHRHHHDGRPPCGWLLQEAWQDVSYHFSKAQKQGQQDESSFRASALFALVKEHFVIQSHNLVGWPFVPPPPPVGAYRPTRKNTTTPRSVHRNNQNQHQNDTTNLRHQERAWAFP